MQGQLVHRKAHSLGNETRDGTRVERGMALRSLELGIVGKADVVERARNGTLRIVEYKRGEPKKGPLDEVQLCAQVMCLEEMLPFHTCTAFIFYAKPRRRVEVELAPELRDITVAAAHDLHRLIESGDTPPAVYDRKKCGLCSLKSLCLPKRMSSATSVGNYLSRALSTEGDRE